MKRTVIDKDVIIQRSLDYGNNFPNILKLWNNYLKNFVKGQELNQSDVSIMMGLQKLTRLMHSPDHEDSLRDLINYFWIGTNYKEYAQLVIDENKIKDLINIISDKEPTLDTGINVPKYTTSGGSNNITINGQELVEEE